MRIGRSRPPLQTILSLISVSGRTFDHTVQQIPSCPASARLGAHGAGRPDRLCGRIPVGPSFGMSGASFWQETEGDIHAMVEAGRAGLTATEAAARLARDGPNTVDDDHTRSFITEFARRLANPLVAILLTAALIAGFTGDRASLALVMGIVFLSTLLGVLQERRAQQTARALRQSIALQASVLRDGVLVDVNARDIVRGDVVHLRAGDLVPADGLLIEANMLQVNEASLTGEAFPMAKRPGAAIGPALAQASNALFQGSSVICGSGSMLVEDTGADTRFGAIAASLATPATITPFERNIHRFGLLIMRLTLFLVLFVLLANIALGRPALEAFLFAMALAVGLTPELLPMIMTVALARGARRMAHVQVVVKRLSSIHDLGEMDILCTDKTGTLTEARIALVGYPGSDGEDDDRVVELAAVNALFETGLKSPLDDALLLHEHDRSLSDWTKLDEHPFDFERRRVTVLVEKENIRIEIVKGAAEIVLAACRRVERRDRTIVSLDDTERARLLQLHDERSRLGLRLLAVAWKPADGRDHLILQDDEDLIFSGFCVFVDPPKASATLTVQRLRDLGIRIKVISGDARAVVEHLVESLSLPVRGVLTGPEIEALDAPALAARVDETDLFARVSPDQKTRIVQALMARGHSVGFLGDGINDAPAIKAADVGLSVDSATDVAREAADMILLSQDLSVLADGVAEGRRTYANIMKYIRMGTSSNFGNMLSMAIASLWLPFLPLSPVQVLLNNFLYDLSCTGIPFDAADDEELGRPRGWDMRALVRFTVVMGPLSSLFDLITFALLQHSHPITIAMFRAGWFMESMATQILVVFVIRTVRRPWKSRPDRALLLSTLLALTVALALPYGVFAAPLGFEPPAVTLLGILLALVLIYLICAEMLKSAARGRASPQGQRR